MKPVWKDRLKREGVSAALTELPHSGCSHLPCARTRSTASRGASADRGAGLRSSTKTRRVQMSPCELGASLWVREISSKQPVEHRE